MLEIIAASSLSHSIEQGLTPEQKNIVKQIVYAEGGFNLNPRTNFKFKNVTDYIRATSKSIILWHDLINNSITEFKKIKPLRLSNSWILLEALTICLLLSTVSVREQKIYSTSYELLTRLSSTLQNILSVNQRV